MPRKYRKMRKRFSRYKRKRSYVRTWRKRTAPTEIKYATFTVGHAVGGPISFLDQNLSSNSTSTSLAGNVHKLLPSTGGTTSTGLLSLISRGTTFGQRIGNKLYAKGIQLRIHLWQCPEATATNLKDVYVRVMLHNGRIADQTGTLSAYYYTTSYCHVMNPVDKTYYRVHYDNLYRIRTATYLAPADPKTMAASQLIKIWIPINRTIRYKDIDYTAGFADVTSDKDIYQLAIATYTGGGNGNAGKQIVCGNVYARIFFTDP